MIYLDNAATTQVSQRVLDAMLPYFTEHYGNAGSIHSMGRDAARAMQKAREQCAKPLNADPNDIIFTSGGSEANTLAIMGLADYLISVGKTHIITSEVEHPSVLECMKSLFHMGFEITYISVDHRGNLSMDELTRAFRRDTGLVSIMTVNNETGNSFPINAIGLLCESRGVLFHTDAVQAYGNINIDMEFCGVDFLSVSGHKFHAPKGVGFLCARRKELLSPVVLGGGQEQKLRSGTENIPSIVGIGEAAEAAYLAKATEHTEENSVLFLWTIDKYLFEAEQIARDLGYKLHARMVWNKVTGIPAAFTIRFGHEYLLYMYKGKLLPVDKDERGKIHSVFTEQVKRHSQKPEASFDIINRLYPNAKKIEMYARTERDGYDCWGNEVEGYKGV